VQAMTIAAVERETGLSKDTLRVWERRYGFPQPERQTGDVRVYPVQQVERLRLIRRLLDRGHRASAIVNRPLRELKHKVAALAPTSAAAADNPHDALVNSLLRRVQRREFDRVRQQLALALLRLGLERLISEVVGPLIVMIGNAWACERISVADEHFFTEQVQALMRDALRLLDGAGRAPRVLLTTLPGEEHQLGLLMAQSALALQEVGCIQLGAQMPPQAIVLAANIYQADVVALSFSQAMRPRLARAGLVGLRELLPRHVALWAGGEIWKGRRLKSLPNVSIIASLEEIPEVVERWRALRPAQLRGSRRRPSAQSGRAR
jgi:MerR family transcriptional regulator, light-induced transcriptional regulator